MNAYRLAADLTLVLHAGFIAFVVLGLLLIWVGIAARWAWVRNFCFRAAHLGAIAIVVVQAYMGVECPLTTLENHLRVRGGQDAYSQAGFIEHWLHQVIFFTAPPWVFTLCYTAFALLVIGTLVWAPPKRARRRKEFEPEPDSLDAPGLYRRVG